MHQRKISADEIKEVLTEAEIIEEYPGDRPFQTRLLLGYTKKGRPLHTVVAVGPEAPMLWVITVYEPDPKEWEEGFKKRRKEQ